MKSFLVYLAGPITGLSYVAATNWRFEATRRLEKLSAGRIECLSPLRFKPHLHGASEIAASYEDAVLSCQRGIFHRDRLDCLRADLVIANLVDAETVSIGTVMEIAWANARDIPVVLAMEGEGVHEHPMLREASGFRVGHWREAVEITARILLPDLAKVPA